MGEITHSLRHAAELQPPLEVEAWVSVVGAEVRLHASMTSHHDCRVHEDRGTSPARRSASSRRKRARTRYPTPVPARANGVLYFDSAAWTPAIVSFSIMWSVWA